MNPRPGYGWRKFALPSYLLLLYFFIHQWVNSYQALSFSQIGYVALLMGLLLALIIRVLTTWGTYREKAVAILFPLLLYLLFFGTFRQLLGRSVVLAPLSRLVYFVPLSLLLLTVVVGMMLRRPLVRLRWAHYFSWLLLLYIGWDLFFAQQQIGQHRNSFLRGSPVLKGDWNTPKPDLYLIVWDEYTGNDGLQSFFGYANDSFTVQLSRRNFQLSGHARSNYSFTVFSMASLLNLGYLDFNEKLLPENTYAYQASLRLIRENAFMQYLRNSGYTLVNRSPFDLFEETAFHSQQKLPQGLRLLFWPTLPAQIAEALPRYFAVQVKWPYFFNQLVSESIAYNESLFQDTLPQVLADNDQPDCYYAHFNMPHEPFVFSAGGQLLQPLSGLTMEEYKRNYLSYLQYTNGRLLTYVDQLLRDTRGQAVILLVSDHGFRGGAEVGMRTGVPFSCLQACYLPAGFQRRWNDSTTQVNLLRGLYNSMHTDSLPFLADTLFIP